MTSKYILRTAACLAACVALAGCEKKFDPAAGRPPPRRWSLPAT